MLTEPLDRYRSCDPVRRTVADLEITDVMIRRRLDHVRLVDTSSASGGRRRSAPWLGWRLVAGCAVMLGVIATISVLLGPAASDDDRSIALRPTSDPTEPGRVDVMSPGAATVGNLAAEVDVPAIDALADRVAVATNLGLERDALTLLSPESECSWVLSPNRVAPNCEEFWTHQVAIGSEIAFRNCSGTIPQFCTLTMAPQAIGATGRRGRTRDLRVELGIEEDRLVIRRAAHRAGVPEEGGDSRLARAT
jgi:hypothetical protein